MPKILPRPWQKDQQWHYDESPKRDERLEAQREESTGRSLRKRAPAIPVDPNLVPLTTGQPDLRREMDRAVSMHNREVADVQIPTQDLGPATGTAPAADSMIWDLISYLTGRQYGPTYPGRTYNPTIGSQPGDPIYQRWENIR